MSDHGERRRNWRVNWLGSIQEFADGDGQRRMWLDPTNTNPHFSFVECMSCYFDGLALSDGGYSWARIQGLVSDPESAAVQSFHALAEAYRSPSSDYDHRAILDDPSWAEVVAAAKQSQIALLQLLDDPHERRVLTEG